MHVHEVKYKGKILAIIFSHRLKSNGVSFLTPNEYTLQLGLIEHPKGVVVRDHIHNPEIKYKVNTTQEFLYLEKGKVKTSTVEEDAEFGMMIESKIEIVQGDVVELFSVEHK